jgi:large subunit ribosomal protein L4
MSPASSSATAKPRAAKTGAAKAGTAKSGAGAAAALPPEIFDAKVNVPLIHQVVVAQEAAARQGTHATKTRGEVRGGGKKPYRQKGTGRARQGSIRAPQFAGGGVVHGPQPRSYDQRTPKKMKAAALRGALSDRARHGRVHVVPNLVDGDTPKTGLAMAALTLATGAPATAHVLVVITRADEVTRLSLRNAPTVRVLDSGQLNTRDVLVSEHVVFTQEALDSFVARVTGAPAPAAQAGNGGSSAAPVVETPVVETPVVETPVAETPAAETPAAGATEPEAERAPVASSAGEDAEPDEASEKPKPRATRARAKKQEDDAQ